MSYGPGGWGYTGYGIPNESPKAGGPNQTTVQTPPQVYVISTAEFLLQMRQPPWIEAGSSGRFECYFRHVTDGPISFTVAPNTTFPTLTIKDGNGNLVQTSTTNGVTVNVIQAGPTVVGNFYSQVQIGPSLPPGYYLAQWTDTYQPQPEQGVTQAILPIEATRPFVVKKTLAPSPYFLMNCRKMGLP